MSNATIATVRTTVNTTWLAFLVMLLNTWFDWDVTVEELLPWTPVIAAVVAFFYRVTRWAGEKWPKLGTLLFGLKVTPVYTPPAG
jgi:hypothetical protein